ncbi:hypothetical protein [Streptomyces sp. NPDC007856]|uniref:hypothetical protein n=1 Tax=Streptomyces sp. NPDC007856 TaxID=3364781 RepID=UPI0036D171A4
MTAKGTFSASLRRAAIGLALALPVAAAVAPTATAAPAKPAVANTWHTKTVTATWCLGDSHPKLGGYHGASCVLAEEYVTATFAYNGTSVWQHWVDCNTNTSAWYDIHEKWCGYWNNGGSYYGYMNAGVNFRVSTPITDSDHYIRINCDKNGHVWVSGS